jgi:hypothetical protein
MNAKPIGLKMKHFGLKWVKIDDNFSQIQKEPSQVFTGSDDEIFDSFPNRRVFDSLNNVTFDIPEEPEYSGPVPGKLVLDEYPERLVHRKVLSQVSRSFDSSQTKRKTLKTLPNEGRKVQNLYYYLHQPFKPTWEKHQSLQSSIRKSEAAPRFIAYLQKRNMRVPSYLQGLH